MANKYRAILNTATVQKVVEAASPAALGAAIAEAIAEDPVDGTDVCYEIIGPLSRRMQPDAVDKG